MTVQELTRHYVKAFKKGTLSSETRIAYDNLKQYGDSLGIDLNKTFFQELLKRYQGEPQKYLERTPEEIDQDILSQYRSFLQQMQEKKEKAAVETIAVKKKERGVAIEIL